MFYGWLRARVKVVKAAAVETGAEGMKSSAVHYGILIVTLNLLKLR